MFRDLLFDNPLITYRGRSRRTDVVNCLRDGNYIYVQKRAPLWWPWARRMPLSYLGEVFVGRGLFDDLLRDGALEDHGETYYERIYRMPPHLIVLEASQ